MSRPAVASPLERLFASELRVVNLGLESFADDLRACGVEVQQVRWRPPAGGDPAMIEATTASRPPRRAAACFAATSEGTSAPAGSACEP